MTPALGFAGAIFLRNSEARSGRKELWFSSHPVQRPVALHS